MIDDSVAVSVNLVTLFFDSLGDVGLTVGWSGVGRCDSGAGRGIWLLIPLMVLVGDWCESCFSGDQVGSLMNCYLVEVMV